MLKKILLFLVAAICLFVLFIYVLVKYSKIPEPFAENTQSSAWSESGKYTVLGSGFTLRDESRETPTHTLMPHFKGLPYRQLETTVWYPESQENEGHPLIVYSHAFMSERGDIHYILQNLSSRGYIVLAANYPLTNNTTGDTILMADVVNQPGDVSFLIDQITNPATEIGKNIAHLIDQDRIGLMGYSLGGLTTALTAYHPTYLDQRIKAAVSIAGPSAMLGKAFYQTNNIPFMMLAGTADEMATYKEHGEVILERVDNSVLVGIKGGSHLGFGGMAAFLRWADNPDSVACWLMAKKMESLGVERGPIERAWYPELGTIEQGIIYDDPSMACNPNGPERIALNPLRQQMLSKVAVVSFLESVFNALPSEREKAKAFLKTQLSFENDDVQVKGKYLENRTTISGL